MRHTGMTEDQYRSLSKKERTYYWRRTPENLNAQKVYQASEKGKRTSKRLRDKTFVPAPKKGEPGYKPPKKKKFKARNNVKDGWGELRDII